MKTTWTDIALGATMLVSLAVLHVMAPLPEFSAGLFSLPPALFFAIPLSQAYLQAIRVVRASMQSHSGQLPRACFRRAMASRRLTWLVLWGAYFLAWEFIGNRASGLGLHLDFPVSFMGSATCLIVISLMVASCLVWAPRCSKLWKLAPLVLLTAPVGIAVLWFLVYVTMAMLAAAGLYDPGYMSMGLIFGPPLLASMVAFAAAPAACIWSLWKGDAWFGKINTFPSEDAVPPRTAPPPEETASADVACHWAWNSKGIRLLCGLAATGLLLICVVLGVSWSMHGPDENVTCLDVVESRFAGRLRVAVDDRYAYYCDGGCGFKILDISDTKEKLKEVSSLVLPSGFLDVEVSGNLAYVSDWEGLSVIDVSNTSTPRVVGRLPMPDKKIDGVTVKAPLACVASWNGLLFVVDVSDPSAPTLQGSYDAGQAGGFTSFSPGPIIQDMAFSGQHVLCACGQAGLMVLDVSNPSVPVLAGTYKTGSYCVCAVDTSGSRAFLTLGSPKGHSQFQIIDLCSPSRPALIASLPMAGIAQDVSIAGSLAYVTLGSAGMIIVDVSNPSSPEVRESYRPYAHGQFRIHFSKVVAHDSLVYLSNGEGARQGLHVLKYSLAQDQSTGHPSRKEPTR